MVHGRKEGHQSRCHWESEPPVRRLEGRLETMSCYSSTLALGQETSLASQRSSEDTWHDFVANYQRTLHIPQCDHSTQPLWGLILCPCTQHILHVAHKGHQLLHTGTPLAISFSLWWISSWDLQSKIALLLEGNDTSELSLLSSRISSMLAVCRLSSKLFVQFTGCSQHFPCGLPKFLSWSISFPRSW